MPLADPESVMITLGTPGSIGGVGAAGGVTVGEGEAQLPIRPDMVTIVPDGVGVALDAIAIAPSIWGGENWLKEKRGAKLTVLYHRDSC